MANRQTYVIGALGVLVGMVVGASSAQNAELVSYSGHNINSDIVRNMPNLHRATGIFRSRSERDTLDIRNGVSFRLTAPRRSSIGQNVERRRNQRESDDIRHFAAPTTTGTVRGAPAQRRQRVPGCSNYTGTRYTHCLEAYINGENYEVNYFPTNY
ncbi:MAG: hypothetical protein HOG89_04150 [Candidatus Peribacter sp.]|jgi:hypothetical protein|nr:hypothetical protein [Candidatus Peribacter sp.]MBT4393359.1 hypothetical protein [Candidatus Peribacter sp.]MBT4600802.1 hypothetical protein [Candidatus Peribacter sp.]MBT5149152.1 hypothetical protein [Candidatus Peribacter sp.]MBT5637875.1 hypothetical protein [Candidatus Peribacter sp.]